MKYILTSLLISSLLTLSGCGSQTIFTPDFIDPADSAVSLPPESSSDGANSSLPASEGSESETSSTPPPESQPEIPLSLTVDQFSEAWTEDAFVLQNYQMRCEAGDFLDSGVLDYCLIQLEKSHPAAPYFNAYYQKDLSEWKASVLSTARDGAALALEEGLPAERYQVSLSASGWQGGGVLSITRSGSQIQGENPAFPFMMNQCFDAKTGEQLTLWDLFSVGREEVSQRLADALRQQAQDEAIMADQHLLSDAWEQIGDYFSPADFSCGPNGLTFYLLAPDLLMERENRLIQLTVPYEKVEDILAYPLAEG